jgi:hypothetical protein
LTRPGPRARSQLLILWLVLAALTSVPYLRAALEPPPGRRFAGTFHFIDDFYNYVSYVQQSEDGHFLFSNKLSLDEPKPALVNLEWWLVGKLSRLLGRRPFLAYRIFSPFALAGLLWAARRWLDTAGLPSADRLPALILVGVGGGLGGLLFELTPLPVFRCVDLSTGLFPFVEALANPHWLVSTWLLLEALLAYARARSWRQLLLPSLLATALALVRPYDFVLLVAVQGLCVMLTEPPRRWPAQGLLLAGLAPVVLYCYWLYYEVPAFATFAAVPYAMPDVRDFLPAFAPALALALAGLFGRRADDPLRLRLRLWTWWGLGFLLLVLRPVHFSLQFAVGLGLPLLLLGALTLPRLRPSLRFVLPLAMSTTAAVALLIVLRGDPHWFPPASRIEAALALRASCRPDAVVMSPEDIGLYTIAFTSCRALVSHPWAPRFEERRAAAAAFYGQTSGAQRLSLLERWKVTHLVLPGDPGPSPDAWLGSGSGFRQLALVGRPPATISLYVRAPLSP